MNPTTDIDHPKYAVTHQGDNPSYYIWALKDSDLTVTIFYADAGPGVDPYQYQDPRYGLVSHPNLVGAASCLLGAYTELGAVQVGGIESLDSKDQCIAKARYQERQRRAGKPLIGDWIILANGSWQRFSSEYAHGLQTSKGGSFYLLSHGSASFSGGLDPEISRERIVASDEPPRAGRFWIFHHGEAGAGRRVDFTLPCKVWKELQ